MKCLRCGTDYVESEYCENCGFFIGSPQQRSYYFQLQSLTQLLVGGELSAVDFEQSLSHMSSALDGMYKQMLSWEQQMKTASLPEAALSVMMKPLDAMKEGIDIFEEALKTLNFYIADPNETHLTEGMSLVGKAFRMLSYSTETAAYAYREVKNQTPAEDMPPEDELAQKAWEALRQEEAQRQEETDARQHVPEEAEQAGRECTVEEEVSLVYLDDPPAQSPESAIDIKE